MAGKYVGISPIAEHVLTNYESELLSGKQIAYQGHVFVMVDNWRLTDGRYYYQIFDNMAMKYYGIIKFYWEV